MALFELRWLRRLLRRKMTPVPVDKAAVWKQRFSVAYMLLAWNAFGFVVYMMYTGRKDWADFYGYKSEEEKATPAGIQWAKSLNVDRAKIIRFSGITKTGEIEYVKEENTTTNENETENLT